MSLAGLALATVALAPVQEPVTEPLVLRGARVLAPEGDRWLDGLAVRVEGDRITAVAPAAEIPTEGARVLALDGLWLVPGLIDLHTHLVLYPYDQRSWEEQVLKESLELRTVRATVAARDTLRAGFTTVRDLGTEGAGYADVGLRDAIELGIVPGPRVVATTLALVATGCYAPRGFDPRWDVPIGAQVADGPADLRVAVREQVSAGADWIKVYADGVRRNGAPVTPTFSLEELEAIVDEATSAGVPVCAHATTDEGARRATLAGVRTIEHGYSIGPETFALMAERGVAFCPTLAANEAMARYRGWTPGEPEPERLTGARAMFRRALDAGVTIACGSDAGVFAHGDNARELELLVDYGMTAPAALRAATSVAAAVLERQDELGRIAPGALADLVVLSADPLASPAATRAVEQVVKHGALVDLAGD